MKKIEKASEMQQPKLQVKIIWSNWIPFFKIYKCYVPSINLLALLVHKKKIFKY